MTLHEAIENLLKQKGRSMTAREIANELNKNKSYSKGDKSDIQPSQITARVNKYPRNFAVDRSVSPLRILLPNMENRKTIILPEKKQAASNNEIVNVTADFKKSFDPISNSSTKVLILGSMPGDKSLALNQYYANPRNLFWKIISKLSNKDLPVSYTDRTKFLLELGLGLWDVAHSAVRKGSLDNSILYESPNEIEKFITEHKNLRVIAFNGKKAEKLHDKHLNRNPKIEYISLPSTSSANTHYTEDTILLNWQKIFEYL